MARHYMTAVKKIMKDRGIGKADAINVYKDEPKDEPLNGFRAGAKASKGEKIKRAYNKRSQKAGEPEKLTCEGIQLAIRQRVDFLSATVAGIRQQLDAYQEELGQLVKAADALGMEEVGTSYAVNVPAAE